MVNVEMADRLHRLHKFTQDLALLYILSSYTASYFLIIMMYAHMYLTVIDAICKNSSQFMRGCIFHEVPFSCACMYVY